MRFGLFSTCHFSISIIQCNGLFRLICRKFTQMRQWAFWTRQRDRWSYIVVKHVSFILNSYLCVRYWALFVCFVNLIQWSFGTVVNSINVKWCTCTGGIVSTVLLKSPQFTVDHRRVNCFSSLFRNLCSVRNNNCKISV